LDQFCVSIANDISRLADVFACYQLPNIVLAGREVDLLERMRRTVEKNDLSLSLVRFHASGIGIDTHLIDKSLEAFQDFKLISVGADTLDLKYNSTKEVYSYGIDRLQQLCTDYEAKLLRFLAKAMSRPQTASQLDEILEEFEKPFRQGIRSFLAENDVIAIIHARGEEYIISPRIYRDKEHFKTALEILDATRLGDVISHLHANPGIPQEEVARSLGIDSRILDVMDKSGIIDPLRLDVSGNAKDYLFSSNLMVRRADQDHLDLVKKTLANFRYGEHYSHKYQIRNLKVFLDYMIDHGYAGKADPIGTDYRNIEIDGVVRVSKLPDGRYRFWMLKEDVVRDVRSIVEQYAPLEFGSTQQSLSSIANVVTTRCGISISHSKIIEKAVDAIREIQEGILK
jgi:hypothetical protein